MIITLINFRCYIEQIFKFEEGRIIRLAGDTGAGKSTIMEAIYWVLYGKLRDVLNDSLEHKEVCSVTLELDKPNIKIYRQSNPGLLQVSLNNQPMVVGDIAQSYINNLFGINNLWLSSCYIKQKSRCAFLNSSNKDKTELLNLLSFQQQDSRAIIDRIQQEFKQSKLKLQEQQIACNTETEIFNREQTNKPFNVEHAQYTAEQIANWKKYLQDLGQQIKSLELQNEQEQHKTGQLNSLTNQLQVKQTLLAKLLALNIKPVTSDEINNLQALEQQIGKIEVQQPLNMELRQIISKLNTFNLTETELSLSINPEQIFAAKQHHKIHTEQYLPLFNKVQQLQSNLNPNLVNTFNRIVEINDINLANKHQHDYELYLQLNQQSTDLKNSWTSDQDKWDKLIAIQWTWDIYQQAQTHLQLHLEQYLPLKQKVEQILAQLDTNLNDKLNIVVDNNYIYQVKDQERKLILKSELQDKIKQLQLPDNIIVTNWNNTDQQQLQYQWDEYHKQNANQAKLDQLGLELQNIDLTQYVDLNDQQVFIWQQNLTKYQAEQNIVQKYGLKYDASIIKQHIINLTQQVKWLQHKNVLLQFADLRAGLSSDINNLTLHNIEAQINEIQQTLYQMQMAQNTLNCPHCNNKVKFEDNKLVPWSSDIVPPSPSNYQPLQNKLVVLKQLQSVITQLTSLAYDLNNIDPILEYVYNNTDVNAKQTQLHELSNLTYPNLPPIDLSLANNILQYNKLRSEYKQIPTPKYSVEQGQNLLLYFNYNQELQQYQVDLPIISSSDLEQIYTYQQYNNQLQELQNKNYYRRPNIEPTDIKILLEYQQLQSKIKDLSQVKPQFSANQLQQLYDYQQQNNKLTELQAYKDLPAINADKLQQIYDYQQLLQQKNKLIGQGATDIDYTQQITKLNQDIEQMRKDHKNRNEHITELNYVQNSIADIKAELDSIKIDQTVIDKLNELKQQLQQGTKDIENIEHAKYMMDWYNKIIKQGQFVQDQVGEVAALQDLLNAAIEVECQHLQRTVDKINRILNLILQDLFDERINVEIKLFKELKSNHKQKAEVNLAVTHKKAENKKYNSLSGGEDDRVSFGLIIALNIINTSPILLLDECFNSLNEDVRETSIEAIRKYLKGKTILVISHNDVEGWYDQQIKIGT